MSYTSEFLLRARSELLAAWEWYEDKQEGLGDRFKKEVYDKISQIEITPERYPQRKKNFYEARLKIFPYLIIFRFQKQRKIIAIVSVFHTSRNPKRKYRL
jgi:mRNA-degrading endonuclease RelE of RelBE toxin-antitoxin system